MNTRSSVRRSSWAPWVSCVQAAVAAAIRFQSRVPYLLGKITKSPPIPAGRPLERRVATGSPCRQPASLPTSCYPFRPQPGRTVPLVDWLVWFILKIQGPPGVPIVRAGPWLIGAMWECPPLSLLLILLLIHTDSCHPPCHGLVVHDLSHPLHGRRTTNRSNMLGETLWAAGAPVKCLTRETREMGSLSPSPDF